MSLFRSLYTQSLGEQEAQHANPAWPGIYFGALPKTESLKSNLSIRIENQLGKTLTIEQLKTMPITSEARAIYSQAGWMFYGQWQSIPFNTLISLFSNPQLYNWIRFETLTGQVGILDRQALHNAKIIFEAENKPLDPLHGGPFMLHTFENYIEYSIPHIHSIILLQGDHPYQHPSQARGFEPDKAIIQPGEYYAFHQNQIIHLDRPGG